MLNRYSTITMESKVVCKIQDFAQAKYERIGLKPWHHIVIDGDYAFVYVWDSRKIELVLPENCLEQDDLTYAVIDNRMDLVVDKDTPEYVRTICEQYKDKMPIVFATEPLTDAEQALLSIAHI